MHAFGVVESWLAQDTEGQCRLLTGQPLSEYLAHIGIAKLRRRLVVSSLRYIPVPVAAELLGKTASQVRTLAKKESLVVLNEGPGYILDVLMSAPEPLRNAELQAQDAPRVVQERVKQPGPPPSYKAVVEKKMVLKPPPKRADPPATLLPVAETQVKQPPASMTRKVEGWPANAVQCFKSWSTGNRLASKLVALIKYAIPGGKYRFIVEQADGDEDWAFYSMVNLLAQKEAVADIAKLLRISRVPTGQLEADLKAWNAQGAEAPPSESSGSSTSSGKRENNRSRTSKKEVVLGDFISTDVVCNQEVLKPEPVAPSTSYKVPGVVEYVHRFETEKPPVEVKGPPPLKATKKLSAPIKLSYIVGSPVKVAHGSLAGHLESLKAPGDGLPRIPDGVTRNQALGVLYGILQAWANHYGKRFELANEMSGTGVRTTLYLCNATGDPAKTKWFEERGFSQTETKMKVTETLLTYLNEMHEDGHIDEDFHLGTVSKKIWAGLEKSGSGKSGVLRRGADVLFNFSGRVFEPVGDRVKEHFEIFEENGKRYIRPPVGNAISLDFSPSRTQASILKMFNTYIPDLEVAYYE